MGSCLNGKETDHELSHLKLLSSLIPSEERERIFLLNSYNHAFKGFSAMLMKHLLYLVYGPSHQVSAIVVLAKSHHNGKEFVWEVLISTSPIAIGARFYSNQEFSTERNKTSPAATRGFPRDFVGHGTHTASIAGGVHTKASYYGLAQGIARGGLPSARIASYKACTLEGCEGSLILKAIDDAIIDGIDIISISIGASSILQSDFLSDPIAIGAFHAEQKGVAVVCSGGNDGPDPYTIVNSAPWIFTIAASSIDRSAINFSPLKLGKRYPLAFGEQVAASFTSASDARNCIPGSLDTRKVAGKIVVCVNDEPTVSRKIKKLVVEDSRAKGVIIIDGEGESSYDSPFDSGTYPFSEVEATMGSKILHYINSTMYPTATILPSAEIIKSKPAPVVASFSSRGPGGLTENILKPDIMAPGVVILAAIVSNQIESYYGAPGNKSSLFGIKSGTSMACPHVTGAMAFIKSVHFEWSFSMIKSALMTTCEYFLGYI
ncbi:hypothetical protein RD792_005695 [Penstemon davidsonii]|uniref:Peptidase S8/S53 domain-containing protein n=1 Tax=Penstemon davidsonii TaxID=160366 RepID=A0ABR0DEI3_9LAMI|nr:hypothetical protein RD792_005695 [Penstemon davidsonii]